MTPAFSDIGPVQILKSTGCYSDNWCARAARFAILATTDIKRFQVSVWLKAEPGVADSEFKIAVDGDIRIRCELRPDITTVVEVQSKARAGEIITVALFCDRSVLEKGDDVRELSFYIKSLNFS